MKLRQALDGMAHSRHIFVLRMLEMQLRRTQEDAIKKALHLTKF